MSIDNLIQIGMLFVAVMAIISTQINEQKQRKFALYAEYTRRYQDLFLCMPDDVYNGSAKIDSRTIKYMRLYFDLCSEEYHLWKQNGISDKTWELWREGMQIATNHDVYRRSWDAIKGEYSQEFWLYFEREVIIHKHQS